MKNIGVKKEKTAMEIKKEEFIRDNINKKLKLLQFNENEPKKQILRSGLKFYFINDTTNRGFKLEVAHFNVPNVKNKKSYRVIDCLDSEAI